MRFICLNLGAYNGFPGIGSNSGIGNGNGSNNINDAGGSGNAGGFISKNLFLYF